MSAHHIDSYLAVIPKVREARREPSGKQAERSTMSDTWAGHSHNPGRYEIRLKGHLGSRWAARFDGMTLTTRADGTTLIEGPVVDQAALHGLLRTLRDIGLPVLSVTQLESGHPEEPVTGPRRVRPAKQGEMAITAPSRAPMGSARKTAFVAGVLFTVTFVTSIPAALLLYTPVLDDANYIVGAGADAGVALGALLEVLLIIANVGTAVVLFPILKRQNEGLALGYVSARLVECTFIAIGIVSLLAVVTLRQDFAGAAGGDSGSFVTVGKSLVAVHDWTFLLGPGFVVGVGNGLILGYLMCRSGLVPRGMAVLGLIGGPLLCAAGIAVLFDVIEPGSGPQVIATAPEFVWELSLGIYLMVKGFKSSGIEHLQVDRRTVPTPRAVPTP
jgi:hypothetical protein